MNKTVLDIDYRKSINDTYLEEEDEYKFENNDPIVGSYTIYRMLINLIDKVDHKK